MTTTEVIHSNICSTCLFHIFIFRYLMISLRGFQIVLKISFSILLQKLKRTYIHVHMCMCKYIYVGSRTMNSSDLHIYVCNCLCSPCQVCICMHVGCFTITQVLTSERIYRYSFVAHSKILLWRK